MDGPERLEDDARPARRATWVVVVVAVAVVAALGAVRFSGVLPDPAPTTPATTPTSAAALPGWPQGIGGGTLYVLDAAGVAAVDVSSGRVTRSALRVDPTDVALTAGGAGVLVWFPSGDGTPHLVDAASAETPTVGPALARARQVLPGPGEGMWTAEGVGFEDTGNADRWRLLDPGGAVLRTASLAGSVQADGAGGLFATADDGRVVHVVDGSPTTSWRGAVGAVGLQGWEASTCRKGRCTAALRDRASGAETPLASLSPSDAGLPVLSLGSRFVASLRSSSEGSVDRTVVRVAVPGAVRELRSFPAADDGPVPLVWLSDRWLAAAGEDGLVLYDAVDDRLVTLDGELRVPAQLVLRPV